MREIVRKGYILTVLTLSLSIACGRLHGAEPQPGNEALPEPVAVELLNSDTRGGLSYVEAAAAVLALQDNHTPLHYKEITDKAIASGWLVPKGNRPELSLYAAISNEIRRQQERCEPPRFFKEDRGCFGLSTWLPQGIRKDIQEHNNEVHSKLLAKIKAMPPDKFEELVGELLVAMGLHQVEVTSYSGDGGIDVRGILPFGGVANINVAVQVKRYTSNVQRPEIQKLRGSLHEHDYGFFITTSDFTSGAKEEAVRSGGGKPIVLVNGRQVVNLLMKHGLGVTHSALDVYELDETSALP